MLVHLYVIMYSDAMGVLNQEQWFNMLHGMIWNSLEQKNACDYLMQILWND